MNTRATRTTADGVGSQSGLRNVMPATAAFVDELRAAFGADEINAAIRDGMRGGDRFFASEAGRVIGRRVEIAGIVVCGNELVLRRTEKTKDGRR